MNIVIFLTLVQLVFVKSYSYLNYSEIVSTFLQLASENPTLVKIYDPLLAHPNITMPQCQEEDCRYFYAEFSNFSLNTSTFPTVLITGAIHGNEKLGPNVILQLAQWLVKPNSLVNRLLNTRRVVLMPLVNPSGYITKEKNETSGNQTFDIQTDFSLDSCPKSTGGKALAAIYSRYSVLSTLSFYSGDSYIAYPSQNNSDDHGTFEMIAHVLGASGAQNDALAIQAYKIGQIASYESIINGFQEWSYVSGNSTKLPESCKSAARSLSFMVKTDRLAEPNVQTLGIQNDTWKFLHSWPPAYLSNPEERNTGTFQDGFGHVTRNLVLSMALIDLLRPYILWDSIENGTLSWRLGGCRDMDMMTVKDGNNTLLSLSHQPGIWRKKMFQYIMDVTEIANDTYEIGFQNRRLNFTYLCDNELIASQSSLISYRSNYTAEHRTLNDIVGLINSSSYYHYNEAIPETITSRRSSLYVWLIMAGFLALAMVLSVIFYKYCQRNENEENIEMVERSRYEEPL